jgi:hypothetical protein
MLYAGKGDLESVRSLLDHGADVNAEHDLSSPLSAAASGRHAAVVRLLIERGADLDGTTRLGLPRYRCLDAALVEEAGIKELVGDRIAPETPAEMRSILDRLKASGPVLRMEDMLAFTDELRKRAKP